MSLFLAPIHFDMFDKIKKQDDLNKELVEQYNISKEELEFVPEGELEEIIDHSNIHGWLQSNIDVVESSFSEIVNRALKENVEVDTLLKWFEEKGRNMGQLNGADEVFRTFTSTFLDGMPCDRAIQPIQLDEESAKWIQNIDVHGKYWEDEGILYNNIREAWLKGLAERNGFCFNYTNGEYGVEKCTE